MDIYFQFNRIYWNLYKIIKKKPNHKLLRYSFKIPKISYIINKTIVIPNNFYKIRFSDCSGTWIINFNSVDNKGKILSNYDIVINDDNDYIDELSLHNSWVCNIDDIAFIDECNEIEKKSCLFLKNKYSKEMKDLRLDDEDKLVITENWKELCGEIY